MALRIKKKLDRKVLAKKYPDADVDFMLMFLENAQYIDEYIYDKKAYISDLTSETFNTIYALYEDYLDSKGRDYFILKDLEPLLSINKKSIKLIQKLNIDFLKMYYKDVSEVYNYKRLYTLWSLDTKSDREIQFFEKPKVIGESDEDDNKINDPGFSKNKLLELTDGKIFDKTVTDRLSYGITKSEDVLDKQVRYACVQDKYGNGKSLNKFLKNVESKVDDKLDSLLNQAYTLGIENAEEMAESDIFQSNPFYARKFVRVEHLDNVTCMVCASLDGTTYANPLGSIHPRCRGKDVPITSKDFKDGLKGKQNRFKNFDTWFNKLEEKEKKSVLGKQKYELYKEGKINVQSLVKSNRVKTLKEVKEENVINKSKVIIGNDLKTARKLIKREKDKLKQPSISNIKNQKELLQYHKYINRKETLYKLLSKEELKNNKIHRNTLNAEIRRERKVLLKKESELRLRGVINDKQNIK